jgi:hypothetical protein
VFLYSLFINAPVVAGEIGEGPGTNLFVHAPGSIAPERHYHGQPAPDHFRDFVHMVHSYDLP